MRSYHIPVLAQFEARLVGGDFAQAGEEADESLLPRAPLGLGQTGPRVSLDGDAGGDGLGNEAHEEKQAEAEVLHGRLNDYRKSEK